MKLKILTFLTKFAQKLHFQSKTKRVNTTIEFCMFWFQFKVTIFIFWTRFGQKEYFWFKTEKSEHHHWIQHVQISLRKRVQVKLTILFFRTKFSQKGYSRSKTGKVTIEFCIFELVKLIILIFWTNGLFYVTLDLSPRWKFEPSVLETWNLARDIPFISSFWKHLNTMLCQ